MWDNPGVKIPASILPQDGRFGCGPSKVPAPAQQALATSSLLGTSHRQPPVKNLVAAIQDELDSLFNLPDGYEVALGVGGSTAFWDVATFSLVEYRASHGVYGEFSRSFYNETNGAPFLQPSVLAEAPAGSLALPVPDDDVDALAWAHNETSTGVAVPVQRIGAGLNLVDATSIAGAVAVDLTQVDAYYFAPQKVFASDGGLWLAILSPAAVERAQKLASDRWIPRFLSLNTAIDNSRKHQTLNTPAIATLVLLEAQLRWLLDLGGLAAAEARARASSGLIYAWAESRSYLTPFVADPALRSPVVATVDVVGIDVAPLKAVLRENGIVDVDAYRKLGRNQLRIGTFPAVDPDDVRRLTQAIDWVVERL